MVTSMTRLAETTILATRAPLPGYGASSLRRKFHSHTTGLYRVRGSGAVAMLSAREWCRPLFDRFETGRKVDPVHVRAPSIERQDAPSSVSAAHRASPDRAPDARAHL